MDKTEPTFVPEWMKNNDDKSASKSSRNKSLDNDLGCPASSSYSFGWNRDRDWDGNKEKAENLFQDYYDSLANILPSWFEKDGVNCSHRSHSNVSAKRVELSPRKSAAEKMSRNNENCPFQRDFPSLGSEEKQVDFEVVWVPSPVLSSVGGDVWTSALAEMHMVGTNGPTSISATANVTAGRNMAETLAQGSSHPQTAHQSTAGSQRLEELAVKQSRQLIPVTPMSKSLGLNSSDKPKIKVVSPQPVSVNADATKTSSSSSSTVGKVHVLKPSRATPIAKETLSPTGGGKLPNSPFAAPLDRKAFMAEKRPTPQAKSRNFFFDFLRKKLMSSNSPSSVSPDSRSTESVDDKASEGGIEGGGESITKNGKNVFILYSEEEEARFLRSLGWEETTEEGGLTEEEINSFYRDVSKCVNSRMGLKGTHLKCLMPIILQMGKNGGDNKVDS